MYKSKPKTFKKRPPEKLQINDSLSLRLMELGDEESLVLLVKDPSVLRYVPWAKEAVYYDAAHAFIERVKEGWEAGIRARYLVIKDDKFVGYCGLWPDHKLDDYYEFGFAILPENQGQGFGSIVVETLMNVCKDELGAKGIMAYVHDDNKASVATVTKFGFEPLDEFSHGDRRYEKTLTD